MIQKQYIQGIFKEEISNRFLCLVTVENEDVLCYIPSSCRLSNFLDMTGRKVLLLPVTTPNARTKYSVFAVWANRRYIPVNLSNVNAVVFDELHSRKFSFLGKRKNAVREAKIDGYKSDIYIKDTNTVIEIKCLLAFSEKGIFPTIYSERGIQQLKKILKLLEDGYKVCYMFISLNPKIKEIQLNPGISEYHELFQKCIEMGMAVHCFAAIFGQGDVRIGAKIAFLNVE